MRPHRREYYRGVSAEPCILTRNLLCLRARLGIVDLRRPVTPGGEVLPIAGKPHTAYDTAKKRSAGRPRRVRRDPPLVHERMHQGNIQALLVPRIPDGEPFRAFLFELARDGFRIEVGEDGAGAFERDLGRGEGDGALPFWVGCRRV